MKRIVLFCAVLALLFCSASAQAALTYGGTYYKSRVEISGTGYNDDPIYLFMNEIEGLVGGTSGYASITFTPGTAPTAAEGKVYYDSASNGLLLYNGTAWITIDTAGASSLGTAYTAGSTVSVITDPITLTVTNTSNNRVLDLVQNDTTNNPEAIRITNTGSGDTLAFVSTGGKDIDGSGSTWSVTSVGAGSFLGVVAGASGVTLSNSETITNGTNNGITFDSDTGNVEDFTIGLGANTNIITFSSASGATTVDLGTMTTLSGMTTITGDAADLTISITADEGGEDLLIQQAGTVDGSLDLRSAGTGTDAIKVLASAGGIDIDSTGGVITITTTADGAGDDITINAAGTAQDSSLILTSDGTGGDAVSIITTHANGDVKINSGDMIDIDAADDFLLDVAGAAGEDILVTNTGGSITLSATEDVEDAIFINATTGGINITADGAAASDLDLVATNGSVNITGGEGITTAVVISATGTAGGIDITSLEDIDITTTGAATEDISITNTGGSIVMTATESISDAVTISASGAAGGVTLSSGTGDITLDTGDDIFLAADTGTGDVISLINTQGTAAGSIVLTATAGGIDVDAAAAKEINIAGGNVAIVNKTAGATAITLIENQGATDQMVFTNTLGTNDAAIDITATAGGVDIDAAKSVTLTSSEGSADSVVLTSTGGGIDILAVTTDAGSEDIDITLSGATDSSIILTSSGTGADAVKLHSNGGTASGILVHAQTGTAAASTTETDASIQLKSTLGGIGLSSALNGADAIRLEATAGTGSTINVQNVAGTGASTTAQQDAAIQLYSQVGGIALTSGLSGADAIRLETSASGGLMTLQSIAGTGASQTTEKDAAIQLYAQAGGIGLNSGLAGADAIRLETSNAAGIMELQSIAGTGASAATQHVASIQLYSQAGGIGLNSGLNNANAIRLESNAGTAETINIHANQGTAVTAGAASIQLLSDDGGIGIQSTTNVDVGAIAIKSTAGGIDIDAKELIKIDLASGTANTSKITVTNTTGTDVAAIGLISTAGGVDINAKEMFTVDVAGGTASTADITLTNNVGTDLGAIALTTTSGGVDINAKEMITLDVAAGTAATADITLTNTPGTDEAAISLQAVAGGVDIDAALAKNVAISGGQVLIVSKDDAASAISLVTNVGVSETIVLTNTAGTGTAAFNIDATLGGIDIDAAKAISLDTSAAGEDIDLDSALGSVYLEGGEADAKAIWFNANNAAGGIDIDFGTGNLDIDGTGASADITIDGDLFSIDGTGTSNVTVTATEAAEDFTIAQAGVLDASLIISSTGTAVDALQLTAATGTGGITINAGSGLINFSDDNLANIGDIAVDDIVSEGDAHVMYMFKTVTRTVDVVPAGTTDDFACVASVGTTEEQFIDLGELIPAYAEIVSCQVRCFEALVSSGGDPDQIVTLDIGVTTGAGDILATAALDALNEISSSAAGAGPAVIATNAARHVWFNIDPEDNWDTLTAGRYAVFVTYIDYSAAHTQHNP